MILDQCPHCQARHVQTNHRFNEPLFSTGPAVSWFVERCQNRDCQALILLELDNSGDVLTVYPYVEYSLSPNDNIPSEIVDDFNEAGKCLGAGCYKASLVMSRRALQRCLKTQGCTQNRLVDAIDYAIENNILRKAFHELATEIREFGNLGAHPDENQLQNANKDNASHVLDFTLLLIQEFFEVPAMANDLMNKRVDAKS